MAKIMVLPKLGVNMEKAKIVEWVVQIGEKVELDQHLLSAETDKAVIEIPATVAGVLARQAAQVGETINCGEPLAVFVELGEQLPENFSFEGVLEPIVASPSVKAASPATRPAAPVSAEVAVEKSVETPGTRVRISPLALKTAKEMGIDHRQVRPDKKGTRITRNDVMAHTERLKAIAQTVASAAAPAKQYFDNSLTVSRTIPLDGIRGTIADRLWQSSHTTARAALFMKADMTALNEWRGGLKAQGHSVSINSLIVAVVARALSEFPEFNARIVEREIQLIEEICIGVAVDTARGLLVPTIRRADQRGVISIDVDFKEKVERAKAGKANLDDLSCGTFTITNLGMFGVEGFIPIINLPEAAILALGAVIREQVILQDNTVVVKPMVRMSLVWDHRLNDGAPAARFLARIKQILEWPMALVS